MIKNVQMTQLNFKPALFYKFLLVNKRIEVHLSQYVFF